MKGIFTISLDFELHWGGFEKWPLQNQAVRLKTQDIRLKSNSSTQHPATSYNQYFLNTRRVIPEMLRKFKQHEVHVTWAGVGMLMHENRESLIKNFPSSKPAYEHQELSAYQFIDSQGIGETEEDDPFHYAHSLVQQITKTPHQELGSHTFAHFYCNEEGQTLEQFRADLRSAQKAAAVYGVVLRSLVFPRNQFNDAYLKVCFEEGFTIVRSNPVDWFWNIETRKESKWKRLNRGLDAYFPLGSRNSYPLSALEVREGFPVCLPASRLLRPYRPAEYFLNEVKINRVLNEMKYAARNNEIYHLWWHPHNFGRYPEESLNGLNRILSGFDSCKKEFGMSAMTMGELAETITAFHAHQTA